MKQAEDYRQEAQALAALLQPLPESAFDTPTLFKGWTINDVIGHLYMFDVGALRSLESDEAFFDFFEPLKPVVARGGSFIDMQDEWLGGVRGRDLFEKWRENSIALAESFAAVDPKKRLKWAGPDMSARSSITARQMETWAHAQEVFDALGQTRIESDKVYNICHLGAATFGWTFTNRKLPVPEEPPHIQLIAPSGAVWEWNSEMSSSAIRGSAVEFAQVVTQVRNIKDTSLEVTGAVADEWMNIAQCFAGPPMNPPAPGSRYKARPAR